MLGPTLERNFFLAYQIHGWQWLAHPLALILLTAAVAGFLRQALRWYARRKEARALPAAAADFVFAGFLSAAAFAAFLSAGGFPFEAGVFPMITSALLALLTAAVALQALLRWRKERRQGAAPVPAMPEGEWSPTGKAALQANARLMTLCTASAVLVLLAGHLAAAFVFVSVSLLVLRPVRPHNALLCAAGATLFVYIVFDVMVSRPWPSPLILRMWGS